MAEISSGNDDKSVGKTNSFKLFGRSPSSTPSRSLSKKKSNPFTRIFSRKKSEKQNVADDQSDSSSSSDGDTGKPEDIVDASTVTQQTERNIPKVIEGTSHGIETLGQQMTNEKTIPEFKESIPATDEKKPDLVSKLKEVAENPKEEILEKGKEGLKEAFEALITHEQQKKSEEKLEKGLKEQVFNALATHNKEKPSNNNVEPPVDDAEKKTTQLQQKSTATAGAAATTTTVKVDEAAQAPNLLAQKLQEEAAAVVGVMQQRNEETPHGENQENVKQEDNCVASLAEGLQKMCATWNKDKKDD